MRNEAVHPHLPEPDRLAAMRQAALALVEADPPQALQLARAYRALAGAAGAAREEAAAALLVARALFHSAELDEALAVAEDATRRFGALGDPLGRAEAETLAGRVNLTRGALEPASSILQLAVARVQDNPAPEALALHASALNHLASVQHHQGQDGEALASLERALRLWRQLNNPTGQAHCLTNIGNIQTWLGQYHTATAALREAYGLYQRQLGDARSEAFVLHSLAHLHHLQQDHAAAVEVAGAAVDAARASRDDTVLATTLLNLGTFAITAAQLDTASASLHEALDLSRAAGYRVGELSSLDSLGSLFEQQGELVAARAAYQAALDIALEIQDAQGELEGRLHLGRLLLKQRDFGPARVQLEHSLALAQEAQHPTEAAQAHEALADLAREQQDFRREAQHLSALRGIERELFDEQRARQTRNLTVQFEVERARHDAELYRLRTAVEQDARLAAEQLVQERTAELARSQREVVTRLAIAAEYRDDTTGDHTRRVGRFAARIARGLGWDEARASVLGVAARLHDVGKIGIPDAVLLKRGGLTAPEYTQMQQHTLIGARILSGGRSELLLLAEEIALTHHERWDGRGYPRGLAGEQIPEAGRIVAVADVYDALTHARPYKAAWTPEAALEEITRQAGSQFDPQVVEVALGLARPPGHDEAERSGSVGETAQDLPLAEEDASHVLAVFEKLLVERTRELEAARRDAEQTTLRMAEMAYTDSLTGLANRRAFERDLEQAFIDHEGERGAGASITVASFDLDGLKRANDTLGHDGGDALLSCFGRHLAAHFGPIGRSYRIGGDEFAVIVVRPVSDQGIQEALQQVMRGVRGDGHGLDGTSVGVARSPEDATTPGDLLRRSDRRMYQDKLARRHRH